jgi:hemerythrin-like domain-containing protein
MRTFCELLALHRHLDELFFVHQRALLRMDLTEASAALEAFETELLAHMQDEEELMLPIYSDRAEAPTGGAAEIFLGEHQKLREYVRLFREELIKLTKAKDLERGVLFLIDSQHLFKRLLVHHDTREKKMLYPILDQVTSEAERKGLFASLKLPSAAAAAATS